MEGSDELLMRRIAEGDAAAFRALADRYAPRLLNYAAKMVRAGAQAEDLVQEALVRVWTNRERYREEGQASAYLYRITHRLCLDYLKSATRRRAGPELDPEVMAHGTPGPERLLEERQRMARLEGALDALPERQKSALLLRTQEGLSQKEIARVLEETEETVESLLARARRHLKQVLSGDAT